MVRRIAFIVTLLSLASLMAVGPTAIVARVSAQARSGPPPDRRDPSQRRDRWDRSRGERPQPPDGDRGGRRRPRPEDAGGDRAGPGPSPPSPAPSSSGSTGQPSSGGPDLRGYARSLVGQHDKNGNMMLEGDERAGLRGEAAKSDLNGDGVITIDELVMHLSAPGAGSSTAPSRADNASDGREFNRREEFGHSRRWEGSASTTTSTTSSSGPDQSAKITNGGRKSYRFRSPKDRLPEGLPGFFSRDANGDGQVSMSEYSSRWSDRTVDEFRRYDQNNDGVITPKECRQGK